MRTGSQGTQQAIPHSCLDLAHSVMPDLVAWLPSGEKIIITSSNSQETTAHEVREKVAVMRDVIPECVQIVDPVSGTVLHGDEAITSDVQLVLVSEDSAAEATFLRSAGVSKIDELLHNLDVSVEAMQLFALPENLRQLAALVNLKAGHNKLTRLPEGIVDLQQLQTLHLSNNLFTVLPESVCLLTGLQSLHLNHNQLLTLTPSIDRLHALHDLQLSHNHLKAVPDCISNMTQLRTLFLDNNQLTALPGLWKLRRIRVLRLECNQISTLQQCKVMPLIWGQMLTAGQIGMVSLIPEEDAR